MSETIDRAAAIARLAELGASSAASAPEEAPVVASGAEVYAGGDEARVLVRPAHLSYMEGSARQYVEAGVGDTVLLTKAEAKRLDAAGATVEPGSLDEQPEDEAPGADATDEQLEAMKAADLVAWVGQHSEHRERVYALEEAKGDKARKTVLEASAPVE